MITMITLNDGRIFPEYKGEVLSWSIGLYMTTEQEQQGFPKAKAVVEAMKEHRPDQLERERMEMIRGSFDKLFGHNARKCLAIIEG